MKTRYLFLCPDQTAASGGIAVIYDMVALLNRSGYEAAIVHNSPSAGYPDYPHPVPAFYTYLVSAAYWKYYGLRDRVGLLRERFSPRTRRLPPLELRPTDVMVTPEFQLAEGLEAFPDRPHIVFVQNPFGMMMSYGEATKRGLKPEHYIKYWLGIADVCQRHMEILGAINVGYFPVSMKPSEFPYRSEKANLITYMPRKRPWEAEIIDNALRRRGNIGGYELRALDGLSRNEVAGHLGRSRIFISLLKQEALGFPAAEAMASGCIVVGFDGLGCEEYFDETTGIPITEGDVASLVAAVEQTVAEYERDPTRLDAIRKRASDLVNERYGIPAFESGVLATWKGVERCLG
jgi:hypothetical protein